MKPFVLVVAPNPFQDAAAPPWESEFHLRTQSGHLASFSNLVRLFNPVGASKAPLANPWKAARPAAGYYLESFLKTHGFDAGAVFTLDDDGAWERGGGVAPVAVALSTTFITTVAELARTLLRVRSRVGPDVPIVVGGALVWKHHLWGADRFAGRTDFEGRPELAHLFGPVGDAVLRDALYVASEFGEHTLLRVLDVIRRGARTAGDFCDVENLVVWTAEGWHATRRAPEPAELDRDFTQWDIVDEMPASMVPVRTSVGCPHRCEFCDYVAIHPRLRLRSVSSIVEELRLISARGGKSVSFVDDNALSSPARARALARAMCENELGLRWGAQMRADRVTAEDAALLAKSGLVYAMCGVESGDPEILRNMGKRSDPVAARLGIDSLTAVGVDVLATFVLGYPGETRASVDASVAFANGLRRDARGRLEYLVFPFLLFPGSPIDGPDRRREYGLTGLLGRWRHATMSAEEVHTTWAPYFFRAAEPSYTYYGGDDSFLWSAARRGQATAERKGLVVAFLDGGPDAVVQERFAALHRTLTFTPKESPDWRDYLAPRERQPTAALSRSEVLSRISASGGG